MKVERRLNEVKEALDRKLLLAIVVLVLSLTVAGYCYAKPAGGEVTADKVIAEEADIGATLIDSTGLDLNGSIFVTGGSGDLNGNGEVADAGDLTMLNNHLNGDLEFTREQLTNADVTGDGKVTYDDLAVLLAMSVGQSREDAKWEANSAYGLKSLGTLDSFGDETFYFRGDVTISGTVKPRTITLPGSNTVVAAMNVGTYTGISINATGGALQKFWISHGLGKEPDYVQITITNPTATDFTIEKLYWSPNTTDPTTYFDLFIAVTDSLTAGATADATWTAYDVTS